MTLPLFPEPRAIIVRPRGDRIEARWPQCDLCMTFGDWPWALARLPDVAVFLGEPYVLRVRP